MYIVRALLLLVLSGPVLAADIEVVALFTDTAVIRFGSEQKMLKVGQSYQGIKVLAADARQATLEINGKREVVGVSRRIGSNFSEPSAREVVLRRNANLQYLTRAQVNGRSTEVLVDTGANVMVLNTRHAQGLGVDYSAGQRSQDGRLH